MLAGNSRKEDPVGVDFMCVPKISISERLSFLRYAHSIGQDREIIGQILCDLIDYSQERLRSIESPALAGVYSREAGEKKSLQQFNEKVSHYYSSLKLGFIVDVLEIMNYLEAWIAASAARGNSEMQITRLMLEDCALVGLSGDCDLYSAPAFKTEVLSRLKAGERMIIIDMRELIYLDSSGVGAVICILQEAKRIGAELRFLGLRGTPRQVLARTNILPLMNESASDMEPALA
jgi:anti-sigma B factor antagonist